MELKIYSKSFSSSRDKLNSTNSSLDIFDRPFYPTKKHKVILVNRIEECDFISCSLQWPNLRYRYSKIIRTDLFKKYSKKFVFYINHDHPEFLYKEKDSIKLVAQPSHRKPVLDEYNIITIPLLMTDHLDLHLDNELISECRNIDKDYEYIYLGQLYGDRLKLNNLNIERFLLEPSSSIYNLQTDEKKNKIKNYLLKLGRGKFGFCPRGGGSNSFRLYECLMVGVVPIITDVIQLPFTDCVDWEEFSIIGSMKNIEDLIEQSKHINYEEYRKKGIDFWEKYCKYPNMNDKIIDRIHA